MAVNQDTPSSTSGTSTENVTNLVDGTTTIMTTNLVDGGHPYFLNSSDSPGMNLINVSFDDESSPLFEQWRRCYDMVIDWLLNSLSKDIVESVIYSQTTEELWSELEKRYEQADGAKLFQLQRELNNISQGTNDVAAYFTRINRIWDQMKVACLVHAPSLKRQMLLGEVFTGLYMLQDLLTQSRSGLNLFRS
nr:uncharacterized protein LOC117274037 [Nicotiana tomentosiformis]